MRSAGTAIGRVRAGVWLSRTRRGGYATLHPGVGTLPARIIAEEEVDALDDRRLDVDIAAQVPHPALRVYVTGQRGSDREDATPNDCAQMTALVADAVKVGALGVFTSRQLNRRSAD